MSRDEKIISCVFIGALLLWSTSQFTHLNATGVSWLVTLSLLFLVYLYSHYAFASLSAHATAMYAAFLAVAVAAGAPPYMAAMGLAVLSNLMAGLTHYATGAAPIYFGTGFITQKDWWRIGFTCSVLNFFIWIVIGSVWWKLISLW